MPRPSAAAVAEQPTADGPKLATRSEQHTPSSSPAREAVERGGGHSSPSESAAARPQPSYHESKPILARSATAPAARQAFRKPNLPGRQQQQAPVSMMWKQKFNEDGSESLFGSATRGGGTFNKAATSRFGPGPATPVPGEFSPGPVRYSVAQSSLRKQGVAMFGTARRNCHECLFEKGMASPGIAKYNLTQPPSWSRCRGGAIGKSGRFPNRQKKEEEGPGPLSYRPKPQFLSARPVSAR